MRGRILRHSRLLALFAFCFCAVTALSNAAHAQDVIVLPPSASSQATATLDPKSYQCAVDADCMLITDGCLSFDAINKNYAANWRAAIAQNPVCKPDPALTARQQTTRAGCYSNVCSVLPLSGQ